MKNGKSGFATGDEEGTVYLWDFNKNGEPVWKIKNHKSSVTGITWMPEGSPASMITSSNDSSLLLYYIC